MEFPDKAIRQGKKIVKGTHIGKEDIKLPLIAGNSISYVRNQMKSTKKLLLELKDEFNKVSGHKINIQQSAVFL